jgi:hypothetical protein
MHDPVDEQLSALRQAAHFPIPDPAAIRRRGDRLRRRKAAIKAGGATLALALAATSVSSLSQHRHPKPVLPAEHGLVPADALSVTDLPARPELDAWRTLPNRASALACIPARVVDALGAGETLSRSYGAVLQGSPVDSTAAAQVHETVLAFADAATAGAALDIVTERLRSHCGASDLANREPLESQTVSGPGTGLWEMYVRKADQVCTECDAAYFDRQAAVRIGDRLVLLSFGELGGPNQPDGLKTSMRRLTATAVRAAAPQHTAGADTG